MDSWWSCDACGLPNDPQYETCVGCGQSRTQRGESKFPSKRAVASPSSPRTFFADSSLSSSPRRAAPPAHAVTSVSSPAPFVSGRGSPRTHSDVQHRISTPMLMSTTRSDADDRSDTWLRLASSREPLRETAASPKARLMDLKSSLSMALMEAIKNFVPPPQPSSATLSVTAEAAESASLPVELAELQARWGAPSPTVSGSAGSGQGAHQARSTRLERNHETSELSLREVIASRENEIRVLKQEVDRWKSSCSAANDELRETQSALQKRTEEWIVATRNLHLSEQQRLMSVVLTDALQRKLETCMELRAESLLVGQQIAVILNMAIRDMQLLLQSRKERGGAEERGTSAALLGSRRRVSPHRDMSTSASTSSRRLPTPQRTLSHRNEEDL